MWPSSHVSPHSEQVPTTPARLLFPDLESLTEEGFRPLRREAGNPHFPCKPLVTQASQLAQLSVQPDYCSPSPPSITVVKTWRRRARRESRAGRRVLHLPHPPPHRRRAVMRSKGYPRHGALDLGLSDVSLVGKAMFIFFLENKCTCITNSC